MFYPDEKKLSKIQIRRIEKITYQPNSYDCGIFTVAYIEQFLMGNVFEKELERLIKLRLWEKCEKKKEEEVSLNSKC
jgi:Ulp1 family protease